MTGSEGKGNEGKPGITWRRHDEHCIRSEDSTYWISRAPVPGRGMVYTAAWRPQDAKLDGVHLGCHLDPAEAKAACQTHAEGVRHG